MTTSTALFDRPPRETGQFAEAVGASGCGRVRAQTQFRLASANVPATTPNPRRSIRVISAPVNTSASITITVACGRRNASTVEDFLRRAGSAATIDPYIKSRDTAASATFQR